ncbi:MAG: plasma-membrane proton-efflux P-type ATPase [Candidatus Eremiobacteraeota bacterium]|nr:plasma-membrane proton-efflux P-type ATPase [Candidatus Eremiobacteraeota bacterium]
MEKKILDSEEVKSASVEELYQELSTSEKGLTSDEVKQRLEQYGYNEIEEKKESLLLKFLSYFWGPIPWMIEIAAILSAFIKHWEDFGIITFMLLLNAVVGFWQEYKADNAIELLKERMALNARANRDGKKVVIPARELVLGDIIRIRLGDIIPADVKLLDGSYILADEAALTGESLPVEKYVGDVAFSGSIVKQGEMNALVTSTGMHTFFGKTAKLVSETATESHFQKSVIKIGNYLIILAAILVTIIFIVALFRHESFIETLKFALVLTVAAIPAALPAVLSVTLATGAIALAKKEAIVSKMVAIEEMAGMDILCSDKTGTITKNELTVAEIGTIEGHTDHDVLLYGALASREENKDPIDDVIIEKARQNEEIKEKLKTYKSIEYTPFDPISKRTEDLVEDSDGVKIRASKGAPQAILELCDEGEQRKIGKQIIDYVKKFAIKGHRALGVGVTDKNGKWHYIGLIALYDPPREDSAETIRIARTMGVDVKMITGDHVEIAKEIADRVNIGRDIVPAAEFKDMDDSHARKAAEEADGFAQVFPEHKYRIVDLLQHAGHIVGMTGDGVNDAPALKKADAGIAVDGATDAAKSAADIVLTKPGLSVIIDAIKESRKIFQRMNSYVIYRVAETVRVLLFIVLTILAFNFYPVTALMIILLALFNDAPIMAIAYDNVKYSDKPEQWNMRSVIGMATLLGIVGVVASFLIFYIGKEILHLDTGVLQTFIFLKLAIAGHLTIFVTRTRGHFWSIAPAPSLLWSAIATKVLATLVAVYGLFVVPIGWTLALWIWVYALVWFVATDFLKVYFYDLFDHNGLKFFKGMK